MVDPRLRRMLEARSVAVVGASERPDSFGWRVTTEVLRSPGLERVHLVNPGRASVLGHPCVPSLADVPGPVDLVLLGVPDAALVPTLAQAAARGDAGAVVYGPAYGLRDQVVAAAGGLAVVGGGCMGFVDTTTGVRAIGYLERDPLPAGSIALVTHSGSVFSALLRTTTKLRDRLGVLIEWTLVPDKQTSLTGDWGLWFDLWAQAFRHPEVKKDRAELDAQWRDLIIRVIQAGVDAGEIEPLDVETFAIMWSSLLDGLVVQVALDDPVVDVGRARRVALDVAYKELGLVAGRARAARKRR
jgi:predicted CoA-binding protein